MYVGSSYLYGNPKIHKILTNRPMRPLISQVGTVTYETSKTLNSMIKPYIPRKHSSKSTYEFLELFRNIDAPGKIASLDVESLFTNVSVMQTIEIIRRNCTIMKIYHLLK